MSETLDSMKFSEQGEEGIGDGNVGIGGGLGRSFSGGRGRGEGDAAEVFGRVQACGPAGSGRVHHARRGRRAATSGGGGGRRGRGGWGRAPTGPRRSLNPKKNSRRSGGSN